MQANSQIIEMIAQGLDHPEGLNFGPDGALYAGGEAGQVYRVDVRSGRVEQYASTGPGLVLGVTLDGRNNLYACHVARREVLKVTPDGQVTCYSRGVEFRGPLVNPNYSVFDSAGNLYYSDSGSYYEPNGAIYVVRPNGLTEVVYPGPIPFPNGLAIDADQRFLYIAQSTAANVVRLPLDGSSMEPEVYVELETGIVPDGLAFTTDGRLVIACYVPDRILIVDRLGRVETLVDDPGADLLNRPTNAALRDGKVYFANLGGWHIGAFDAELPEQPLHYPVI